MKKILSFLLVLVLMHTVKATHNRSGMILYKRIAPFTNVVGSSVVQVYTYSITVIKYTDHGSTIADRCADTVYFGDGQKGVAPRTNGSSTCNCGSSGCGSVVVNDPGYVVKMNLYTVVHTYAGPGQYILRSSDPNRNAGIHNIPNSSGVSFTIESLLIINSLTGANSSPALTFDPIDQASLNVCFSTNHGVTDADGDSLSYELVPCLGDNGVAPGYFYPETVVAGNFSIHPTGGTLTWCNPVFLDTYNIAFKVKEWRKNTSGLYELIGYITCDRQIIVRYGVVGVKEISWKNELKFYPNPFSSEFKIDLGKASVSKSECAILDVTGKAVFVQEDLNVDGELKFDLSALSPGIYIVRMNIDGASTYIKIVKE